MVVMAEGDLGLSGLPQEIQDADVADDSGDLQAGSLAGIGLARLEKQKNVVSPAPKFNCWPVSRTQNRCLRPVSEAQKMCLGRKLVPNLLPRLENG